MIEYVAGRWQRVHATDSEAGWWCPGVFSPGPVAFVGLGHPSAPGGWPVHVCETCGEQLFIDGPAEVGVPSWHEARARLTDAVWRGFGGLADA